MPCAAGYIANHGASPLNLELNEEQQLLQRSVREFAEAEVKPRAKELDDTGHFPLDTVSEGRPARSLTAVAIPVNPKVVRGWMT